MAMVEVNCPRCGGRQVSRNGKGENGKQRYICQDQGCTRKAFLMEYRYEGSKPGIEEKIIAMAGNASGIRDTARVLGISTDKVMNTLKKTSKLLSPINLNYINEHPNIEQLRCHVVPFHEVLEA